jgi:uncharacterized protein (TIGR01777 family)
MHLSRTSSQGKIRTFTWDVDEQRLDAEAIKTATAIIHLAGASIADKPWTKKRKQEILESRTHSTALLCHALKHNPNNVKTFVSSSGVNYYGVDKDQNLFTEDSAPGDDYLSNVVVQWEQEVDKISELGIRIVKLRTGFVLSKDGGALKELARPIKLGVGAPLGTGKQRVSWIHIDDVCEMFIKAISDSSMNGGYNAGGPYPVSNEELTKAIAKVLGKPLWLPNIPAFVLKMLLGEMVDLVLEGTSVSSQKIQQAGFTYNFDSLESALRNIYNKPA